jgi:hypothetical protein
LDNLTLTSIREGDCGSQANGSEPEKEAGMHRLRLSRGGRLLLALAVGGAIFGIASAVQADIPDSVVIHGCYGKAGTPYKGNLRVRDASSAGSTRTSWTGMQRV